MDSLSFSDLFCKALHLHRNDFFVDDNAIELAIRALQNEYSPKPWKSNSICYPINYNDPAFRCAYLHKYAACHAALVQEVLLSMLSRNRAMLGNCIPGREPISICCLGGGPGTDIIGLLSVFCLLNEFRNSTFEFMVVDCMTQWAYALLSVMQAAQETQFQILSSLSFSWRYLQADMLSYIPEPVIAAIKSADMVTMVKFVSAAASEVTPNMIRMVFTLLKPGALVFFIDNAAGGFYEMVSEIAFICGLSAECEPFQHVRFGSKMFKRKMFGSYSLSSTQITAQVWRKNLPVFWNPYGYRLVPLRSTLRVYSRRHYLNSSKLNHERRTNKQAAASNNASLSPITLNSKEEESQEVRNEVQNRSSSLVVNKLCADSTGSVVNEKLPTQGSFSAAAGTSSESSSSKRKLSAGESEILYTNSEEPSTRKVKLTANKSDQFSKSNEGPSRLNTL